jgi:hypothetical protein
MHIIVFVVPMLKDDKESVVAVCIIACELYSTLDCIVGSYRTTRRALRYVDFRQNVTVYNVTIGCCACYQPYSSILAHSDASYVGNIEAACAKWYVAVSCLETRVINIRKFCIVSSAAFFVCLPHAVFTHIAVLHQT